MAGIQLVKPLLDRDENGNLYFIPDFPKDEPKSQEQSMVEKKSSITNLLNNYYQSKPQTRASNRINGNQKQLLSDTIDELGQQYPYISQIKDYLMDTAAFESGFKQKARSSKSSASGWFQFIDSTRNSILNQLGTKATREQFMENPKLQTLAKLYSDIVSQAQRDGTIRAAQITREQFMDNPKLQVLAAAKLYSDIVSQAQRDGTIRAAQAKGFSVEDVVHGYWLNPSWARAYFLRGEVIGSDANGTTIPKYLEKIHKK